MLARPIVRMQRAVLARQVQRLSMSASGPGNSRSSPLVRRAKNLPANTVVKFVPQQEAWVVERMGRFSRILEPGLAILLPFLDRIAYTHDYA
ncbi:Stomatin-like protein 2, mitochondrial [Coemansia sp. D1744]|nr:Stomatin-like protein 2, mitochondrial [Coemansia sp. D1744]